MGSLSLLTAHRTPRSRRHYIGVPLVSTEDNLLVCVSAEKEESLPVSSQYYSTGSSYAACTVEDYCFQKI